MPSHPPIHPEMDNFSLGFDIVWRQVSLLDQGKNFRFSSGGMSQTVALRAQLELSSTKSSHADTHTARP